MSQRRAGARAPRTVLERKIWERNETLAEFAEYAERFAQKTGEPGTISERNLKRLVSGRKADGSPINNLRPATARLLERIFGLSIGELLSSPEGVHPNTEHELRQRLAASGRVDGPILTLLDGQLGPMRRLDRELGAVVAHDEVVTKMRQVTHLQSHSLTPRNRQRLSAILAQLLTLAGWQALDLGNMTEAWQHYERAKTAANESGLSGLEAHAAAEQAVVLLDLAETVAAVQLLDVTRRIANRTSPLLRSWLAAAHGEALAKNGDEATCLRAFDRAAAMLPAAPTPNDGPFVILDGVHLARWRGHALGSLGNREAVPVLTAALDGLDPTYTRAEAGLRIDLACSLVSLGEQEDAQAHLARAESLAAEIGSVRQQRRLKQVMQTSCA